MGVLFSTPELFSVFVKVAHDYHLPVLAVRVTAERSKLLSLLSDRDIILESLVMANTTVLANEWQDSYLKNSWQDCYLKAVKNLKPGLTEMIVHLGHDNAELQAVTLDHPDYGSACRQRDFAFVTSPAFKNAPKQNHVALVKWKDLKKLVN